MIFRSYFGSGIFDEPFYGEQCIEITGLEIFEHPTEPVALVCAVRDAGGMQGESRGFYAIDTDDDSVKAEILEQTQSGGPFDIRKFQPEYAEREHEIRQELFRTDE